MGNITIGYPFSPKAIVELTRQGIMAGEVNLIRDTLDGLCHKGPLGPIGGLYDLRALSIKPLFNVFNAMACLTRFSIDKIRVKVGDRIENKLVIGLQFSIKPLGKGEVFIGIGSLFEIAKSAVYGLEGDQIGILNKLIKVCPKLTFGGFDKKPFNDSDLIIYGEKSSDHYMWSSHPQIGCPLGGLAEPKKGNQDLNKRIESHRLGPGLSLGRKGWQLRHALWQYLRKTGFEFACFVEER